MRARDIASIFSAAVGGAVAALLATVVLERLHVFPSDPACAVVLPASDPWLQARFGRQPKVNPALQEGIPDVAEDGHPLRKARRWLWEAVGAGG